MGIYDKFKNLFRSQEYAKESQTQESQEAMNKKAKQEYEEMLPQIQNKINSIKEHLQGQEMEKVSDSDLETLITNVRKTKEMADEAKMNLPNAYEASNEATEIMEKLQDEKNRREGEVDTERLDNKTEAIQEHFQSFKNKGLENVDNHQKEELLNMIGKNLAKAEELNNEEKIQKLEQMKEELEKDLKSGYEEDIRQEAA